MQVLNVFPEWFIYGESDLFFFGVGLILVGILLPWRRETQKRHITWMVVLFAAYLASEAVLHFLPGNYMAEFAMVFLGGGCLAVAVGRLIRFLIVQFRRPQHKQS